MNSCNDFELNTAQNWDKLHAQSVAQSAVVANFKKEIDNLELLSLASLAKRLEKVGGDLSKVDTSARVTNGERSIEEEESFVPIYTPQSTPRPTPVQANKQSLATAQAQRDAFTKKRVRDDEDSFEEGEITDEDSLEDGELFEFQDDDRDEDYIPKKELRRQLRKKQRMQEKEFCVATTSDDNDDDDIVIIAVNGVKVKK